MAYCSISWSGLKSSPGVFPAARDWRTASAKNPDLKPTLYFLLSILALHLGLEFGRKYHEKLKNLLFPALFLGSLTVIILGIVGMADVFAFNSLSFTERALLMTALFVTARVHGSAFIAVGALLLGYAFTTIYPPYYEMRLITLTMPLKLASFGLLLTLCGGAWQMFRAGYPRIMESPFAQKFYQQPSVGYFFLPAILFSLIASSHQLADPYLHADALEALAPYVSAAATILLVLFWRVNPLLYLAIAFLALGNVHTVRIHGGEFLTGMGLSPIHLFCLGLAVTMIITAAIRNLSRKINAAVYINRSGLTMAAIVLALLTINYSASSDLMQIAWFRFAISGTMALIAGLYFRYAARHPGPGEEKLVNFNEGVYHYALSVTIWCAALMIPWFRTPYTALYALALPVVFFYLNAEINPRIDRIVAGRFRNSAAVLSCIILALYVFRFALQMTMFPDSRINLLHYHYCAPAIMVISLIMLRLHGLGGNIWLAFYGGIGFMTSTYFTITTLPKLSPFDYPVNGAFCAIILGHLWIASGYPKVVIAAFMQQLIRLGGEKWLALRHSWGVFIAVAVHIAVGWGIFNYTNPHLVAPLLLGVASISLHLGFLKKSPTFFGIAGLEILLAVHADFLVPSWLDKDYIIWLFIAIWTIILVGLELLRKRVNARLPVHAYIGLTLLIAAHLMYHGLNSTVGLTGFATTAILAALTPCHRRNAQSIHEGIPALLLLLSPTWLIFFGQIHGRVFDDVFSYRTIITVTLSLLITGTVAKYYRLYLNDQYEQLKRSVPRLFDLTLNWTGKFGTILNLTLLSIVTVSAGLLALISFPVVPQTTDFILLLSLILATATAWCLEGIRLDRMAPFFIMELCASGAWSVSRNYILKTIPGFWKNEYDIWLSLATAVIAAGLLQLPAINARKVKVPLTFMLCAMPVTALALVVLNQMGTNTLLLVIGLYSMIFVFMGKDDRESPYHIFAVTGFVAFFILLLWTKLEIRVIHAFVIPAGAGVLVLLQLFREKIAPEVRNQVRLITLLIMLGSAGYYALLGTTINVYYVLTFGILALIVMLLGSFLRIRLYLVLGFGGLIVDIGVVFVKLVMQMQRSSQMTIIGSLVLAGGIAIVAGAIVYKTHREKMRQQLEYWRNKLSVWE